MVVDTSAIVAVLLGEPESERIDAILTSEAELLISAATHVELAIVVEGRAGSAGSLLLGELIRRVELRVVAVDADLAITAIEAWRRYGKGRHPAGLNYGDCFSYALAISRNEPLLFVGRDFGQTDVVSALGDEP